MHGSKKQEGLARMPKDYGKRVSHVVIERKPV